MAKETFSQKNLERLAKRALLAAESIPTPVVEIPVGGSDGQVLTRSGSSVVWANASGGSGDASSPIISWVI